jgi:phosphoglycolate phosphatase-like HAD superfamily hydrolase
VLLGPAPIVDFDGTVAHLPVDWAALRERFGVPSVDDLWHLGGDAWETVADAEEEAARRADPIEAVCAALQQARGFAVLTANAESSVRIFLSRFPELEARARAVAGRETLAGPKWDRERFSRAFEACRSATAEDRGSSPLIFVGDAEYELDLARACGARVLDVAALIRADRAPLS